MKDFSSWYSDRVRMQVRLVRWGATGRPLLLFPTAGGDAEECERRGLVGALGPLLEEGRLKVYSIDSIAGATWLLPHRDPLHCAWMQNRFDACIHREIVPAIRQDCRSTDIGVLTAGASIGAFNAVAALCRHPEVFTHALGMSGTYDLEPWMEGHWSLDFYYSSPLHFLPNLAEGPELEALRHRFVVLATGEGRWEDPEQSWRMAQVLGSRGIPNRVDPWGPDWDHDWSTWIEMLPRYLAELV